MQLEQYRRFYELEGRHWWFLGMRDIFFRTINNNCKKNGEFMILDVGCGSGLMMKDLEKFGKVVGVDIADAALRFCQERKISRLCQGNGISLPFKDGVFDLVASFSVVEHVQDDGRFLKELNRVCKVGGKIMLSAPAYNFLWSRHDLINEHKRRYTKDSLKKLFFQQHLAIEKISYTNFILFPFILPLIILDNLLKHCGHSLIKAYYGTPKLINNLLAGVFKIEAMILTRFNFPYGVSLLCVGKKM